ncbi:MAG: DUF6273 domain-containing protein [Eubacterium sp.]|nr:DUF6273 domain-containing protein [Eubacterium sp.]
MKKIGKKILCYILIFIFILSNNNGYRSTVHASEPVNDYDLRNPRVAFETAETIYFGNYWQEDTNGDFKADILDEKLPVRWQILKRYDDNTALVISEKALDVCVFNPYGYFDNENIKNYCMWDKSYIRKWLNGDDKGDFYREAFSDAEQNAIISVSNINAKSSENGIDAGADTNDKVFLLSLADINNKEYSITDISSCISDGNFTQIISPAMSSYAWIKNRYSNNSENSYWLRSPGTNVSRVTTVDNGRKISYSGTSVFDSCLVKPVIKLDLSSAYVTQGENIRIAENGAEWDTITFGTYNGNPIIWRVLNVQNDDAFLLSDKILCRKAFNSENDSYEWKDSTLREWLNGEFYNTSFSEEEKAIIKDTIVKNSFDTIYNTNGGEDTTDKVFLLSLNDVVNPSYGFAENYDVPAVSRRCKNLAGFDVLFWWLRSPGKREGYASVVNDDGEVNSFEEKVTEVSYNGVRPAIHISLKSDLWEKGSNTSAGNADGGQVVPLDSRLVMEASQDIPEKEQNTEQSVVDQNTTDQSGNNKTTNNNNSDQNTKSISKKTQRIKNIKNITKVYSSKKFKLNAKTTGDGKLTYQSSNKKVAKISSKGVVTLIKPGTTKIIVTASESPRYKKAKKIIVLTVKRKNQKLTSKVKSCKMEYTTEPFSLGFKAKGNAKISYKSSNPNILKVSSKGVVTLKGLGKASIIIKSKKTSVYKACTRKITINVTPPKIKLKCNAISEKRIFLKWSESPIYDGYYAEFSKNPAFTDLSGAGVFEKKKSPQIISGFSSAGVKYYIRMRPYKYVNGTQKFYSWSNVETVVTKD